MLVSLSDKRTGEYTNMYHEYTFRLVLVNNNLYEDYPKINTEQSLEDRKTRQSTHRRIFAHVLCDPKNRTVCKAGNAT